MPSSKLDDHATAGLEEWTGARRRDADGAGAGALCRGRSGKVLVLMDQLEIFANAHFLAEQHLMRLHAYPGFESHEVEHDRLIAEICVSSRPGSSVIRTKERPRASKLSSSGC